jgi:mono/diheme cytochrome c family protein
VVIKVLPATCLAAILGTAGAASWFPEPLAAVAQPPAGQRVTGDPERGQYLVEHVAMCPECHSPRDDAGSIIESRRFMGAPLPPPPQWSRDWAQRAPRNAGLPGYSDEAARRLLMEGAIDRHGVRLRPPMPRFRMTAQDAEDVIAYMRTVP